jgi:hypothetical protein
MFLSNAALLDPAVIIDLTRNLKREEIEGEGWEREGVKRLFFVLV